MPTRPRAVRRAVPVIAVVVALAAGIAIAQAPRRVLHQDLPAPSGDRPGPTIGDSGSGNPTGLVTGDKILPEPSDPPPDQAKDEPVLGAGGFAADRQTSMKPDDNTGADSTLHYVSVFNPDVLPFKRMSALDGVRDDFSLEIARAMLTEVPVGGKSNTARDRFWGSMLVKLAPNTDVPLPSVAPDMRILSYEIDPPVRLRFSKDGADNFYVRSDESNAHGTYRLRFYADADAAYFAPTRTTGERLTPRRVAAATPPGMRPVLPDNVRAEAKITLDKLGVDEDMDLDVTFNRLIEYFRRFEAKDLPRNGGNIYRELCDARAGVCRHRAFAFMVTANALGLPTRYVHNEAHAFVEVWFPPPHNWQRIDLGGAALRMEVTGGEDKTLHRPRREDVFPKPEEYTGSYTQLEGDIRGLSEQQIADKRRPLDEAPPSGSFGSGSGSGSGTGTENPRDRINPDPTLEMVPRDPKKPTPRLDISIADHSVYRGDVIHVEGRVSSDNKPLRDHPVDVFLAPAGAKGRNARVVGRTVTDERGQFSQDFPVPGDLDLATYEIYLSTPEDASYNAALSD
ncbi:MAG: transglutaminase domain-containing protein [Kofleriaceae bacterium]